MTAYPRFRSVVLDTTHARALAEFYRELLGWTYVEGGEPPPPGDPDPQGEDWLVLLTDAGTRVAFQQVPDLAPATWPEGPVPQQLHLDLSVPDVAALDAHHARALDLGAVLLRDEADDPEEPIRIYADPSGHPFCLFVVG
ncbi:VOC family protein [Cellulomonas sp. PhB143]|uniref:VOC family protein n=1 Tax=Cellulomonas sp. PhB143 TaxID=2485186 RepID=UPI000F48870B|nr:VOC family protein [Cellulomonas sp. PhB143]ROS79118.1 hypothetical protein EDF32_0164 [Cellulomonas sp. PhB143]